MLNIRTLGSVVDCFIVIMVWSILACCSTAVSGQEPEQPNIIFILTDDQGVESIEGGFISDPWSNEMNARTPTLARLADLGVSFTNARVNANCSPTRAALFTGRSGLRTGVIGIVGRLKQGNPCSDPLYPLIGNDAKATDLLSLQAYEKTIGEALQAAGYYTILIDKWHVGQNLTFDDTGESDDERGLRPTEQGFNVYEDWHDYICLDDPDKYFGDENNSEADDHMVLMAGKAVDAAINAPEPWALFYHTISPHRRHKDTGNKMWWEVDQRLIPLTRGLGDSQTNRYIQNVEAIDTVIREHLLYPLGVIDSLDPDAFNYRGDLGKTVVVFLSDNGTDQAVSVYADSSNGPFRAKGSPYEGGINVPLIVFGERISEFVSPLRGTIDTRQVAQVDFFETLADIAGVPQEDRANNVGLPREGISFADAIGWDDSGETQPERQYTLASCGAYNTEQEFRVSFVSNDGYKLIVKGGGTGVNGNLHEMIGYDEFYNLKDDPYESLNLINAGMTEDQTAIYYDMRDKLVDYWPTSVSVSYEPTTLPSYFPEFYDDNEPYVLVVWIKDYILQPRANDQFYNYVLDPDRENNLYNNWSGNEEAIYLALRAEVEQRYIQGDWFTPDPDVRVVDIPIDASRVMTDRWPPNVPSNMPVGHENVGDIGGNQGEYRAFLSFVTDQATINGMLPPGYEAGDAVRAQIIVFFDYDSQIWFDDPQQFWDNDAATGPIKIHPVTQVWGGNLFNDIDFETELGLVNLLPHIVVQPPTDVVIIDEESGGIRPTPMPSGTPVSFGHNEALLDLFTDWYTGAQPDYGVALVATLLTDSEVVPNIDQHVHFLRNAILRIMLDRNP